MKKYIRFLFIGTLWTALFLLVCLYFFVWVWNFNFLSASDRAFLTTFWNNGGVIKSYQDYLFVFSFVACLFIWIFGFRKALRTDYVALVRKPFELFSQWEMRKYQPSSHIVLKNIGTSVEAKSDDKALVEKKLKSLEKELDNNKKTEEIREIMKSKFSGPKS